MVFKKKHKLKAEMCAEKVEDSVIKSKSSVKNSLKLNFKLMSGEKSRISFNKRLQKWLLTNSIGKEAGNNLLALLSEKISNLPKTVPTSKITSPSGNDTDLNSAKLLKEMKNRLTKIDKRQSTLETGINTKLDRLTVEVLTVRNEMSAIKSKIYNQDNIEQHIHILKNPLNTMEEYKILEDSLKDEKQFSKLLTELNMSSEKTYDKFVRASWRRIFTDNFSEQFSWRGTATKKCIQTSRLTSAIRYVFKQKFALQDWQFDKVTQRHFQYARDRNNKFTKYHAKKEKSKQKETDKDESSDMSDVLSDLEYVDCA